MPTVTITLSEEAHQLFSRHAERRQMALDAYLTYVTEHVFPFCEPEPRERLHIPLTSIKGFVSTLLMDEDGTMFTHEDRLEFLRIMDAKCDRLKWFVHDPLRDSLVTKSHPKPAWFVLRTLLDTVQTYAESSRYRKPTHTLLWDIAEDVPLEWRTDEEFLKQALNELLENALKYSPDGGEVRLTVVQENPETLRFTVRDQGLGVTPAFLTKLRLESSTVPLIADRDRRIIGGRPFLQTLRLFVHWSQGEITLDSPGLNQGVTVSFTLPNPSLPLPISDDPHYERVLTEVRRYCLSLLSSSEGLGSAHAYFDATAHTELVREQKRILKQFQSYLDTLV